MFVLLLALALQEGPVATAPAELPDDPPVAEIAEPTLAPAILDLRPVDQALPAPTLAAGTLSVTRSPAEVAVPTPAPNPAANATTALTPAPSPTAAAALTPTAPPTAAPPSTPTTPQTAAATLPSTPQPYAYPRPPAPAAALPATPQPYTYPRMPPATAPGVYRRPEPQRGYAYAEDSSFDATIRGRALSAAGPRGPLDGGWLLHDAAGQRLFAFQFLDDGPGTLDGAWTAVGGSLRSGFFALAARAGAALTLRWIERPGAPPNVLEVAPTADPRVWTGRLDRAGETSPVTMRAR